MPEGRLQRRREGASRSAGQKLARELAGGRQETRVECTPEGGRRVERKREAQAFS